MRGKAIVAGLAAAGLTAGLIAGCGGGGSSPPSPPQPAVHSAAWQAGYNWERSSGEIVNEPVQVFCSSQLGAMESAFNTDQPTPQQEQQFTQGCVAAVAAQG